MARIARACACARAREGGNLRVHKKGLQRGAFSTSAIQARTSSTFHAVTPADSFTGAGNVPAFTLRQSVAAENGMM